MKLSEWIRWCDKNVSGVRSNTAATRSLNCKKILTRFDIELTQITSTDIQEWINGLKLAQSTKTLILVTFTYYLTRAVEHDRLTKNPAKYVTVTSLAEAKCFTSVEQCKSKRFLSIEQCQRICIDTMVGQYVLIDALGMFTGLRRGELAGLRWSKISSDFNWISVEDSVNLGVFREGVLKSDSSRRLIPICPALKERLILARNVTKSTFVLSTWYGKHYDERSLKSIIPLHGLRRTFATYLGLTGLDSFGQNLLLGHAQSDLRDKVYRQRIIETLPPYIEKMEDIMLGRIEIKPQSEIQWGV